MHRSIFEIPEPAPLDAVNGDLPATDSLPSEQQELLPTTTTTGEAETETVEMEQEMAERNQTPSTPKYVKVCTFITHSAKPSIPLKFTIRVPTKTGEEGRDGTKIKIRLPSQAEQPMVSAISINNNNKKKNRKKKNSREEEEDFEEEDFEDDDEFEEEEEELEEEEEEMARKGPHSNVKIRIRNPARQSIKRSSKGISSEEEEEDISFSSSESEMDSKRFK